MGGGSGVTRAGGSSQGTDALSWPCLCGGMIVLEPLEPQFRGAKSLPGRLLLKCKGLTQISGQNPQREFPPKMSNSKKGRRKGELSQSKFQTGQGPTLQGHTAGPRRQVLTEPLPSHSRALLVAPSPQACGPQSARPTECVAWGRPTAGELEQLQAEQCCVDTLFRGGSLVLIVVLTFPRLKTPAGAAQAAILSRESYEPREEEPAYEAECWCAGTWHMQAGDPEPPRPATLLRAGPGGGARAPKATLGSGARLCCFQGGQGRDPLPADHLPVPVHRDVGPGPVVIRSKVTVGGSKPFIESMLQGVELRPVAQMPRNRNPEPFRDPCLGEPQSAEHEQLITFTEHFRKQVSPVTNMC